MSDARTIAVLDMLSSGYHAPVPDHPDHERLLHEWATRCRVRLACAARMPEAVSTIEAEEPWTPPSP